MNTLLGANEDVVVTDRTHGWVECGEWIRKLRPHIDLYLLTDESIAAETEGELDVYDRVGGGDGFSSGFFYGLLNGAPLEEAVKLGWAHGALLTTYPGDTTMAMLDQVRALAAGGSSRIQR